MVVCLIPGPNKGGNIDTWLFPLIEEMKSLDRGSQHTGLDAYTGEQFTLRAWLVNCSADGPQLAELNGMARPGNACRPCHHCTIKATKASTSNHHYVIHKEKHYLELPHRTGVKATVEKWSQIKGKTNREYTSRRLGMNITAQDGFLLPNNGSQC